MPRVISAAGDHGSAIDCGAGNVVSFGFGAQFSSGAGLNYASTVVLKGSQHVAEGKDQLNRNLASSSLATLSLGQYDAEVRGFKNADFSTDVSKTQQKCPTDWTCAKTVHTIASGDEAWNSGLTTSSGATYYAALQGNLAYAEQKVEDQIALGWATLVMNVLLDAGHDPRPAQLRRLSHSSSNCEGSASAASGRRLISTH